MPPDGKERHRRRAKGDGSIFWSERRQRYVGVLDLGWHEGRRVRKETTGKTEREARLKLADLRRRFEKGLRVDRDQQTVEQFLRRWLTWKEAHVRPRTIAGYRTYIEGHAIPALGKLRLVTLRTDDVQAMLDRRKDKMAPRSLQHLRDALRGAMNDAIRWDELERNPASFARAPAQKTEPVKPFTKEDAKKLLAAMNGHRMERLFGIALSLGLRRSEIAGLKWAAVDFEEGTLRVREGLHRAPKKGLVVEEPKSATSARTIPLPRFAVDALKEERKAQAAAQLLAGNLWTQTGYVFTDEWGKPYDPDRLTHAFKAVARAAGYPDLHFHGMRHAAATMLLAKGVPLSTIQEILGHASYYITKNIYGHVAPELTRAAADAMDETLAGTLADKRASDER